MKPITVPLPFFGLTVRIEAVAAPRRGAVVRPPPVSILKSSPAGAFGRRVLQDVGLDDSRRD